MPPYRLLSTHGASLVLGNLQLDSGLAQGCELIMLALLGKRNEWLLGEL